MEDAIVISDSDDEQPGKRARITQEQKAKKAGKKTAVPKPSKGTLGSQQEGSQPEPTNRGMLNFQPLGKDADIPRNSPTRNNKQNGAAHRRPEQSEAELWSKKYAPKTEVDLVVPKKKVHAVRDFLEDQEAISMNENSKLLLITGPPGCGKTTTVQVLASELGYEVVEWVPPVPTLWSEHMHQAGIGLPYISKLDAFETFVAHAKLAPLQLSTDTGARSSGSHKRQKLILINDLPHIAGAAQKERMVSLLGNLARTSNTRIVIIMTDTSERRTSGSGWSSMLAEIRGLLDRLAAAQLSFNKVTTLNAAKVLNKIAEEESIKLESADAHAIAEFSGGDLLNAIETFQLFSSGKVDVLQSKAKKRRKQASQKKIPGAKSEVNRKVSILQRDVSLSNFHALGKLLYNKREGSDEETDGQGTQTSTTAKGASQTSDGVQLSAEYERTGMPCDPEDVLDSSGLEPASAACFLHENCPHFVHDDAIDNFLAALDYFSDADRLLSGASWMESSWDRASIAVESCGVSVAARGLMWSNKHPAPKRWLPLKGPVWFAMQNARQANTGHLLDLRSNRKLPWGIAGSVATDLLPFLRIMSYLQSPAAEQLLPPRWAFLVDGKLQVETRQTANFAIEQEATEGATDFDAIEDDDDN